MTAAHRIVLCLGPHRSGTSLITAALGATGADLAMGEVYANPENVKGFFEHPDVLSLDEALLSDLDASWDALGFDGAAALARAGADPRVAARRAEAVALVARVFAPRPLSAVKDPRMSILLPFWHRVLADAGFARGDILSVVVLRDPVEVALSQRSRQRRDPAFYDIGRDLGEGAALWLQYMQQTLDHLGPGPVHFVGYHDFLGDPRRALRGLTEFTGATPDPAEIDRFVQDFVDPALYRSRVSAEDRAEVAAALPEAAALFAALSEPTPDLARARGIAARAAPRIAGLATAAVGRLARDRRAALGAAKLAGERLHAAEIALAEQKAETARVTAEMQTELKDLRLSHEAETARVTAGHEAEQARLRASYEAELRKAARTAADLAANEGRLAAELQKMRASRSWRVTAPLRLAGQAARGMRDAPRSAWLGVNRVAMRGYRGLASRHPGLANGLKRALWPVLMLGNRAILKTRHRPLTLPGDIVGTPAGLYDFQRVTASEGEWQPRVTVIVPNYNHAPYLRQRLDTIYAQTYRNFDVLLMDDCSTDDSRAILEEYADRHPDRTRVLFNETNSGGAFFQWEKGFREAGGDLIWIAESDDWSSENFLETLVPFFRNQAVQLAYGPSVFMNETGDAQVWSMDHYLADLGPERWHESFVLPAPQIVREAFAERNIIPNVSSALFRRFERLDALENDSWRQMRTCGDWLFYLNVIRGGCLAYSPAALNYYRMHPANTSRGSFSTDRFYQEHEIVAKAVARHYRVEPAVLDTQRTRLVAHWKRNRDSFSEEDFDRCYNVGRIRAESGRRKPHLLMVGYAFCAGGGETFPIQLANLMKTAGYAVTFLNCAQEPEVAGVRDMLARDIPVVSNLEDLARIVDLFDIDVIHSHHAWVDMTILDLLPEGTRARTVVTLHGMYETIPAPDLRRILPRLVEKSDKLVYTAEKNLTALLNAGLVAPGEVERIDNALERRPVTPLDRAALGIPGDAFVLTLVSRALAEKGWAEAIRAVERARTLSGAEIRLVLIGEGPVYDGLCRTGVPDFVHLEGFRQNIREYFAASDLGFLPSRYRGESFPLVVIDCLNAGRPVLASKVGEIEYMLSTSEGPAGVLFDLEEWAIPTERLAEIIARLARDPGEVARLAARVPEAGRRFDPAQMRDSYDLVYAALMHGEGSAHG